MNTNSFIIIPLNPSNMAFSTRHTSPSPIHSDEEARESYHIKFTYNSPKTDFVKNQVIMNDESLNIKHTLMNWKTLLQNNIELIDDLLKKTNEISEMYEDGDNINVIIQDKNVANSLIKKAVIGINEIPIMDETDEETHDSRLSRINRISSASDEEPDFEEQEDSNKEEQLFEEEDIKTFETHFDSMLKNIDLNKEIEQTNLNINDIKQYVHNYSDLIHNEIISHENED
jgi:hypothetical protein